jgi:hypothetical protein
MIVACFLEKIVGVSNLYRQFLVIILWSLNHLELSSRY